MSESGDYLAARGISDAIAEAADIFPVPDASQVYSDFKSAPALVLPYYDIYGEPVAFTRGGEEFAFCRVRYMGALSPGRGGRKPLRYTQPGGSGCHAYFAPQIDWRALIDNVQEPLMITEGEIKALAVSTQVAPCIGLGGVNSTVRDGEFLSELAAFAWQDREVYICFDSDAVDNPRVTAAEARLVEELQTKRGARCRLMRIPPGPNGAKMGVDDYLVEHGVQALCGLVQGASDLYALDAKVIALNRLAAWVEQEGLIFDLEARVWVTKDNFKSGNKFSSIIHIVPSGKGGEPKKIHISHVWLTHPHAQRYAKALFRPGEGDIVTDERGSSCLNLWGGWDEREGDVSPFLELSEFLFQRMEPADREMILKLFAYKFQNPAEKIPLAPVLIGPQGCGKSMWARCIREAVGPYGQPVPSSALYSDFGEWQERSLIATIDEAKETDMVRGRDVLKSMISEQRRSMNAKYRPARPIDTFYQIIITSNSRASGAFTADDRRMIVIDCPPKREVAFYTKIGQWLDSGGAKALAHWFLNYDLAGWKPPANAPLTAEKHMAYIEGLTPVQRFADDCRTADENRVKMYLDAAVAWAEINGASLNPGAASAARATLDAAPHWQIRPFYTPDELSLMLPMFIEHGGGGKIGPITSSGQISRQLRDAGVTYLRCSDDPHGFRWGGRVQQFLIIANCDEWDRPISQADFDRAMANMPRYAQMHRRLQR